VGNAGICSKAANPQPIDQVDEDAFDAHMRINARGVFLGSKYSVQQFLKQEPRANGMRGWIVNFASMVSTVGLPGLSKSPPNQQWFILNLQLIHRSWIHRVQRRSFGDDEDYCARCGEEGHCRQLHCSWMSFHPCHTSRRIANLLLVSQTAMLEDALGGGALSSSTESVKAAIPRGLFGHPLDHARAAVYLASDDAQWVTGITLNVDGGLTAQ
jgi:NAD(P)-dependent dehydrogenase (short-subunit alcohol dehydrogenase family)